MKVLIIVDKNGSAIDRLANLVVKHNPHLDIRVLPVHPKKNDVDTIYEASSLLEWCDVIDIHYWKSGEVLRQNFGAIFEKKPSVLFHFNPYDAEKAEINSKYKMVVVGNNDIHNKIPYSRLIPYAVDLDFFEFKEDYTSEEIVHMSVNRIEGKKGVLQVAEACRDLGYKLRLVGRVSDGEYMQKVLDTGAVEFIENATDEILRDSYYNSAIHVCNSEDNFESGTLPILEAMACGVPVLTRNIGHVPDLNNGKNMIVREGVKDDVEDLKKHLKDLMENRQWRLNLRNAAWETVRTRGSKFMASRIVKLYYSLYMPEKPLVSVIIPTKDNPESFVNSLVPALAQDYPKYEVIVSDSGETPIKKLVDEAKKQVEIPIKYIHFEHKGNYTLAEARNRAVIEADGAILVFCDDRLAMEKNAISEFLKLIVHKSWVWGVKDDAIKGFVENFSAVHRSDLVKHGMFNERMQWYGGMTQDIRTRFEREAGFDFVLCDTAKAKGVKRATSKARRRKDIVDAKYLVWKLYGEA